MPTYASNKKARFDYDILETLEAGIVLSGPEVKSVRGNHISLTGSYVSLHNQELYLLNVHIAPYPFAGRQEGYDPTKSRKLLLKSSEIAYLGGKLAEKGLTIVPLSVYTKGRHIKVEIGLARGKKHYDKRESIKKREVNREIARVSKRG